jgi:hypothetical protein
MSILDSTQEAVVAHYRNEALTLVEICESGLRNLVREIEKHSEDSIAQSMLKVIDESRHAVTCAKTNITWASHEVNNPAVHWILRVDYKLGLSNVMKGVLETEQREGDKPKGREYEVLLRSATQEIAEAFAMGADQFRYFEHINTDTAWVDHTETTAKSTFSLDGRLTESQARVLLEDINDMVGGKAKAIMENDSYGRIENA